MTARTRDRLLWAAGLAAAAVVFAQTWTRAARPGGIDLTTYLDAARALAAGNSPYTIETPFPYLYPAFLAFALIPFAWLPDALVLTLWFAASVAAAVWVTLTMIRAARIRESARLTPIAAAVLGIAFPFLQSNLRNGQVNLLVLAGCVIVLTQFARRPAVAGVAWGATIATKIVPGVLGLFLLRRRAWQALGWGAGATLLLLVAPAILAGAGMVAGQFDQATRLAAGSFGAASGAEPLDFSAGGVLIAAGLPLPPAWLRVGGAGLVLGVLAALDWRMGRDSTRDAGMFALAMAAIPLISPKSEMHHLAFVLPALAMVVSRLVSTPDVRTPAAVGLAIAAGVSYAIAFADRSAAGPLLFDAVVALAAALIVVEWQQGRVRT